MDTLENLTKSNVLNLNIGNGIGIAVAEEKHEHEHIHDTWGGDIGRAALGGAITGLASGIGIKGGEFLGKLAGNAFSDLVSSSLSKSMTQVLTASVNASVNAATMSTMNTLGTAMANTTIYGGNFKDVLSAGRDSLRDKDNLKSIAVSTLGAGITTGITTKLNIVKPTTFTDKLTKNAIDGATNTALQSTINGDSFKDTLKHQVVNSLVMTGAEYGANAIGGAYYNGNINKVTQLTLHTGLGAITSKLTGGDFASGAVAGVVGEIAGGYLKNNTGLDNESIVKYSGLISGLSAIVVSKANNGDIKDITNSAFAGQRVGENAVRNNLLHDQLLIDSKDSGRRGNYGPRDKHPKTNKPAFHHGVDTYTNSDDKSVHAAADGTVIYTEPQVDKTTGELKGWGNQIVIEHEDENGNKYITRSAHLKEKPNIPVGTKVREGQPIGIMGNTGGSAGAHLHFEILKQDPTNPKADKNGWVHVNPQLPENNIGNYNYLWETPYQDNKREYKNIMEQLNSPRVIMPSVIINRH